MFRANWRRGEVRGWTVISGTHVDGRVLVLLGKLGFLRFDKIRVECGTWRRRRNLGRGLLGWLRGAGKDLIEGGRDVSGFAPRCAPRSHVLSHSRCLRRFDVRLSHLLT
jgi:hypothetical protein